MNNAEMEKELRALYLNLMQNCLSGFIYRDSSHFNGQKRPFSEAQRQTGRDWPSLAHSMIGLKRLQNLCELAEQTLQENVPGDFIETGVWRGGACILLRAVLKSYGVNNRRVYVADSFAGLPTPDVKYSQDAGANWHEFSELAVSLEEVQANFAAYGLLDEQVVFLKGWFKDTLPAAGIGRLAILRLDGDMYGSTMDALEALYNKVSLGGFIVVDDYHTVPACKQAVYDFCTARGVTPAVQEIDGNGVYWRKA